VRRLSSQNPASSSACLIRPSFKASADPIRAAEALIKLEAREARLLGLDRGNEVKRWVILVIVTLICVAGCGAQQQETAVPASMTPNQQQAFHDCMKQRRQEYILPLGPVFVDTAAKQQRDYDACVAQAKAAPSAAPSPSPTKP
jgi:hypothetical protein